MAKKKIEISNAQKLGIGVGLTTAAVAAAGAYFLYGSKDAAQNRKKVKGWALKAKGEVLSALENAEKITESEFKDLVDGVTKSYAKVEKLSKKELDDFKKEMADNWDDLVKSGVTKVFGQQPEVKAKTVIKKKTTVVTKKKAAPKKTTKKATKKTTKKAAAKKTA